MGCVLCFLKGLLFFQSPFKSEGFACHSSVEFVPKQSVRSMIRDLGREHRSNYSHILLSAMGLQGHIQVLKVMGSENKEHNGTKDPSADGLNKFMTVRHPKALTFGALHERRRAAEAVDRNKRLTMGLKRCFKRPQ